jgi:hypothetical protein
VRQGGLDRLTRLSLSGSMRTYTHRYMGALTLTPCLGFEYAPRHCASIYRNTASLAACYNAFRMHAKSSNTVLSMTPALSCSSVHACNLYRHSDTTETRPVAYALYVWIIFVIGARHNGQVAT